MLFSPRWERTLGRGGSRQPGLPWVPIQGNSAASQTRLPAPEQMLQDITVDGVKVPCKAPGTPGRTPSQAAAPPLLCAVGPGKKAQVNALQACPQGSPLDSGSLPHS